MARVYTVGQSDIDDAVVVDVVLVERRSGSLGNGPEVHRIVGVTEKLGGSATMHADR